MTSGRLAASLTSLYCSMSWPQIASSKQPTTGYACNKAPFGVSKPNEENHSCKLPAVVLTESRSSSVGM